MESYVPKIPGVVTTRKIINKSIASSEQSFLCVVCLEMIKCKDKLGEIVRCKHTFHLKCIDKWVRVSAICPMCRNVVYCR